MSGAATGRFFHEHGRGLAAHSVLMHRVAVVAPGVNTGSSTRTNAETIITKAPEATNSIFTASTPTRVFQFVAFIHVDAMMPVERLFKSRIAPALDTAIHVDAHSILAHVRVCTLVHIYTELPVLGQDIAIVADTPVAAWHILADTTLEADAVVVQTLINVNTGSSTSGQGEATVTLALVRPSHVDAAAVTAHATLLALISITAVCSVGRRIKSWWTDAPKTALGVDTLSQGAVVVFSTFINLFAGLASGGDSVAVAALATVSRARVDAASSRAKARSKVAIVGLHFR